MSGGKETVSGGTETGDVWDGDECRVGRRRVSDGRETGVRCDGDRCQV